MIEHKYESITGFLNYTPFYKEAVEKAKDGDLLVEIGCFLGKSTSFMATEIANSGKELTFHTMDLWEYDCYSQPEKDWFNGSPEKQLYHTPLGCFVANIDNVKEYVTSFRGDSKKIVENYEDDSIDFLFIDGDHSSEGFKKDLELWYPKVKHGGVFSGHDFDHPDIRFRVKEFFKEPIEELDQYQPWTLWRIIKK